MSNRNIILILIIITLSGCAISGNRVIHSPNAVGGIPLKHRHIHGGATKKSPPDAIEIKSREYDSLSIFIGAQPLKDKKKWGGIFLPVVPIFYLPAIDYYDNDPNSLIVNIVIACNNKVIVIPDSMKISADGIIYKPHAVYYNNTPYSHQNKLEVTSDSSDPFLIRYASISELSPGLLKLKFTIDAHSVNHFRFLPHGIFIKNKQVFFPNVNFVKNKQKYRFWGHDFHHLPQEGL